MSAPPLQFSSPMQPVAPPSKKIKSGVSADGDETVSRRRQELQRLKEKAQMRTTPTYRGAAPPPRNSGPPTGGPPAYRGAGPPPPPPGATIDRVRQSDIFPSVQPKVAPRPPTSKPPQAEQGGVARRLDPSFAQGRSSPVPGSARASSPVPGSARAKSAPPSRPPPPPGPTHPSKEAPETTPSRGYAGRPPPMTPGSSLDGRETPKMTNRQTPAPTPAPVPMSIPPPTPAPMPVTTPARPPIPAPATSTKPPAATPSGARAATPPLSFPPSASKAPGTEAQKKAPPADGPPPTTTRKDLIRNLHQYADTPGKPTATTTIPGQAAAAATSQPPKDEASGLLRLEQEMREHEKGKTEALRKVAILEDQLQKLKEKGDPQEELDALLQMAEREGEVAALQWARQKVSGITPRGPIQVGFFSPQSPGLATPRSNPRKRIATPYPKRDRDENETETEKLFTEAVKYTPFEYTTQLATFLIRRPYGNAADKELWFKAGFAPSKQYEKNANVKKPSSLEVVAQINADGSMMSLHGDSSVRHIGSDVDADWVEFGSYDELDKPLGSITYIDSEANEKDYSLDEVFEGALAARENYCTSVVSMGKGLKAKGSSAPPAMMNLGFNPAAQTQVPKPEVNDVCVGTEDLPFDPPAAGAGDGQPEKRAPPPDFDDDGGDLVSAVLGSFVGLLLWIVKTILITVPVKIVSFMLFSLISFVLLSMLWLQLVDDHGAGKMGAPMDFMYNRHGIV